MPEPHRGDIIALSQSGSIAGEGASVCPVSALHITGFFSYTSAGGWGERMRILGSDVLGTVAFVGLPPATHCSNQTKPTWPTLLPLSQARFLSLSSMLPLLPTLLFMTPCQAAHSPPCPLFSIHTQTLFGINAEISGSAHHRCSIGKPSRRC